MTKTLSSALLGLIGFLALHPTLVAAPRPNIILAMADDMGWGDPGYNSITVTYPDGTPHPDQGWISTPTMDAMATNGLRFDRFYSASAVCSPTRASCLTGRNPFRVGVPFANTGRLGFDETPLSEVLSAVGYRCAHVGKWHLGTMTTLRSDANRGPNASVYSAPWHHAYDFCFATESKVPTYHPYRKPNNSLALPNSFGDSNFYGTHYWRMPGTWNQTSGEGNPVPVNEVNNAVDGDDSKLLVDQAIPFIQSSVAAGEPFFVVLWFHTPHKPMVDPDGVSAVDSSDALRDSIEDMDTALGRLRTELTSLGVRGNTMFWLTSDNGPENGANSPNETSTVRSLSSGRFLERKRSLHEGGVRVPGILEWPDVIPTGISTDIPAITSDYYPTILDYLCLAVPDQKPLDGISLRPVIEGTATTRTSPIGFKIEADRSWVNQQYKLIDDGGGWELYDLVNIAPGEEVEQTPVATAANIGSQPQPIQDTYNTMLAEYSAWETTVGSDTPYIHPSRPTVTLDTPLTTVAGAFTVTATFSKDIAQLHAGEFAVVNGTASELAGAGSVWTVTISPFSPGQVQVSLPEAAVIDADGNPNAASPDLEVTYSDPSLPPGVTLSGPAAATAAYTLTVDFTEPVSGLSAGDFQVLNGTASGVSGGGSGYTVTITPTAEGDVSVTLPAGSVTTLDDAQGNSVSNTWVTSYLDPPTGSIISNGELNQGVTQYGSARGNSGYYLDPGTLDVLEDETFAGSGSSEMDTGIDAGEWLWSTLSRGFAYDPAGGAAGSGDGAFVPYSPGDPFNQKPRAVAQFTSDASATVGLQTIGMDVYLDDNSGSNALAFLVELYAWNSGETGPKLSLGGPTGNDPDYNVTIPGDARTILDLQVPAAAVADGAWETVVLDTVDLNSGHDYYAWRIGVMGVTTGDNFAFDKLTVTPVPNPDPFADWAAAAISAVDAEADASFTGDPDGDFFANAFEWILGGDPMTFDPRQDLFSFSGGGSSALTIEFTREDASEGATTLAIEFSNDLFKDDLHTSSVPATTSTVDGVSYVIDENGTGPDRVTATIPASGSKQFARLRATQQ